MLENILYLFLLFIIYSFLGWFIETSLILIRAKRVVNRGFLMGPYCPIYGFGALILISILPGYIGNLIGLFIVFAVYATVLEYFTSFLMEKLFNARWWDYTYSKFNINGRVCLENSLAFGTLGVVTGYYIHPVVVYLLGLLEPNILIIISIILALIFFIDLCITYKIVSRLRKNIVLINKDMTEDISEHIMRVVQNNHFVKAFPLLKQTIDKIIKK
ncbi:MAG: putative ABC transporter permease [Bacilli bacterium]|nr:putative ABC transporter permease [Bacilli bacterium]MDD4410895.1 putative ABC transporter permease [Bacilli bacterium]